jgi:hypothetical protein
MTDDTREARAGRLVAFLASAEADRMDDDTPILDVVGYPLTFGDLRAHFDYIGLLLDEAERVAIENKRLRAQLRMQETGDRAELALAESRVHWPATEDRQPRASYETTCGDMRGRSTMIASAVTCPACRAWMSGEDDEVVADLRAARDMLRRPEDHRAFPIADWLIYSHELGAWWKPFEHGYTHDLTEAGRYIQARAEQICRDANAYGWVNGFPKEVMVAWTDDPQTAAAAIRAATGRLIAERSQAQHEAAADIQDLTYQILPDQDPT